MTVSAQTVSDLVLEIDNAIDLLKRADITAYKEGVELAMEDTAQRSMLLETETASLLRILSSYITNKELK